MLCILARSMNENQGPKNQPPLDGMESP
jgi:hypothetical protein